MNIIPAANPAIKKNSYLSLLQYVVVFMPAVVYVLYVYKYAVNVPAWDDYEVILKFILSYRNAHGLEKLYLLFGQENEHRIALSKIVYALYYSITGNINFRNLIFIGNIQLLFTFVIFVVFIKKCLPRQWIIASFVLGLCMFDLNNWQNADFASSCMANYGVLFFLTTSLFFYDLDKRKYILPAVILQACCTFSYGNGMIASGLLLMFTFFSRDRIKIIASGLTFMIFSPLYFFHFVRPPLSAPLVRTPAMIAYFFHFMSAYIEEGYFNLPVIVGIIVAVSFVVTFPINKKLRIKDHALPFICILGFVIISAIPASILRSNVVAYIPSRYRLYSDLLPALFFIFMLIKFQGKKTKTIIAGSYMFLVLFAYTRDFRQGSHDFAHLHDVLLNIDYYYDNKDLAKSVSLGACQTNMYCIDKYREPKIIY